MVLTHVFVMTTWCLLNSIVTAVNPNWLLLLSFKPYRCIILMEYWSQDVVVHFHLWLRECLFLVWVLCGCWTPGTQFGGLLFAPTVTLPCTCSSDRGWCGVGPLGRKYKPLSFRCLADESCGGPAAPRFRHVPPTTQWGVFVRILDFAE